MMLKDRKAEILIIDDTVPNLKILSTMLSENQYKVRAAVNGELALKTIQVSKPDLILLDVRMPDMDGIEVCRRIKANPETADIPVIFISALKEINDKVLAFQAGGVDYITKPFQVDEVLARVKTQIDLQRRTQQISQMFDRQQAYYETLLKLKDDLLSMTSHDIKNPLFSINSNLFMLRQYLGEEDERVNYLLKRIEQGSDQILGLVTDILELARIEMGLETKKEKIAVRGILERIADNFQSQAEAGGIQLTTDLAIDKTTCFRVDQLEQVVNNLVSNAVKYTPSGGDVVLKAFELDGRFVVQVKDTGYGIPSEDIPYLFNKFYRVQSDYHTKIEGTGLGLSIAKTIVEQHGGEITIESQEGNGSTFTVEFPV